MNLIDLSKLPAPQVIEKLDYETILAALLADLHTPDATFTALVESDPAYKVLQVAAYREVLLRQRINDAAQAVMLAYASFADLEHLAAFQSVVRLIVDPGDPEAWPPIAPTYEDDDRLRQRVQLASAGQSTAGAIGAYEFHALSAAPRALDIDVSSPAPCEVLVTVLSNEDGGIADAALLTAVYTALSSRTVRPLTDQVTVQSAEIISYTVAATLYVYSGPDPEVVRQQAEARGLAHVQNLHRLGYDVVQSGLDAALHLPGVQRVELETSLPLPIAVGPQQASLCTALTVVLGGVDE